MLKSKNTGSMSEVILPDFSDDDNTTTVTKSRRVSFGTNIVKEFIVGSAVSAQCMLEYEQAFPSSDSSNADSSHSAIESEVLDQKTFVLPVSQKVHKPALPVSQTSEPNLLENRPKPPKFSSTICFNVDSPTADMEFTEGCITLAKSILDKKNKEMTVIIQAKSKEDEKVKDDETKYFDSEFEMSVTRCLKPKENKREEKEFESDKTKIFSKFEDEMSITKCNKVFNYDESDSSFEDCKENRIPLDVIMRHLDKDTSDLENDLFNPEKTFNNLFSENPFDFSSDSEKLDLNESMDITAEIQPIVLTNPVHAQKENKSTGLSGSNESMEISCEFQQAMEETVEEKSNTEPEKITDAPRHSEIPKPEESPSNKTLSSSEFVANDLHVDIPLESESKIIDEKPSEQKSSHKMANKSMEISDEVLKETVNSPSFGGEITNQILEVTIEKINGSMDASSGLLPLQNDTNKSNENEVSMESQRILSENTEQSPDLSEKKNIESVENFANSMNGQSDVSESEQLELPQKIMDQTTEDNEFQKTNLSYFQPERIIEFSPEKQNLEANAEVQSQPFGVETFNICSDQANDSKDVEKVENNIQEAVNVSTNVFQPRIESILQESMEISVDVQSKPPFESTQPDTSEESNETSICEKEPSLVDVKVIESLKELSKEPGCVWSLEDFRHPQTKSPGWLSFSCVLLESTATISFYLKISRENSLSSCSSVTNGEVILNEENQFRLPEYQLVIDFGFQELKKYFEQHRQKVETIRLIPYFLDQINLFIFKTNSYLRQIYNILTLYPGSRLTGSLLSFRLYSFPIFFSSLVSIDLTNLFRLSDCSLSFVRDFGNFDENKIREIFQKCVKFENSLCEFVVQSTKYLFDLEKKTGYVTRRRHIKLLPPDLKL